MKGRNRPSVACVIVVALLACSQCVESKRGGRVPTSSRRVPNYPRQQPPRQPIQPRQPPIQPVHYAPPRMPVNPMPRYPSKPVHPFPSGPKKKIKTPNKRKSKLGFPKGGMKTLGKIALAAYIAKQLTPSINFRPYRGYDRNRHASMCHECMSINGSDIGCERGFSRGTYQKKCRTSLRAPYCSTEYGITSDDVPYVRRSCNERRCQTCKAQFSRLLDNSTKQCYTIQCDMCNWNNCNDGAALKIFHEKWKGCEANSRRQGVNFTSDDTCGSSAISRSVFMTFAASLLSFACVLI